MTIHYYRDTTQPVLTHDRVLVPKGDRGEITSVYLGGPSMETMVPQAWLRMDDGRELTYQVAELTYLPPEVETIEAIEVQALPGPVDPEDWIRGRVLQMAIDARTPGAVAEELVGQAAIFEAYLRHGTVPEVPEPAQLTLNWGPTGIAKVLGVDVYDQVPPAPDWPRWGDNGQPILPGDDFRVAGSPKRQTVLRLEYDGVWSVRTGGGFEYYPVGSLFHLPKPDTDLDPSGSGNQDTQS
jgi:hypothetical protein